MSLSRVSALAFAIGIFLLTPAPAHAVHVQYFRITQNSVQVTQIPYGTSARLTWYCPGADSTRLWTQAQYTGNYNTPGVASGSGEYGAHNTPVLYADATYYLGCQDNQLTGYAHAWGVKTIYVIPPTPAAPAQPSYSCNGLGTQATISWPAVSGATFYQPRIDPFLSVSLCPSGWSITGTTCYHNNWTSTSFTQTITPGAWYSAWVHAGNSGGVSAASPGLGFSCAAPAQPTLTITGNGQQNSVSVAVGTPVTIQGTYTAASGDTLAATALNDYQSNALPGVPNNTPNSPKSYMFTPAAPGSYVFYPAAQTAAYPSWNNYGKSLTVTVPQPPPTATLIPSSQTISEGADAFFSYTTTGTPTSASYRLNAGSPVALANPTGGNFSLAGLSAGSHSVQVTVSNSNGSGVSNTASVDVTATPPSISSLQATPARVRKGANIALAWTGTNLPASCTLSSAPSVAGLPTTVGSAPTGGNTSAGPVNFATIFTLSCGSANRSVNVGIVPIFIEM